MFVWLVFFKYLIPRGLRKPCST